LGTHPPLPKILQFDGDFEGKNSKQFLPFEKFLATHLLMKMFPEAIRKRVS